jgi:DNA-binding NtrC family response regulator
LRSCFIKFNLHLEREESPIFPELSEDVRRMPYREAKDKMISMFHNQYITTLLRESGGNISKAAEIAGIQRQYLHRLMREAEIEADQFKKKHD